MEIRKQVSALRREAQRMQAQARRLMDLAAQIERQGQTADAPPLKGKALAAAQHIKDHPGHTGEEIADAIGCAAVTFRKHIYPAIAPHGFVNRGFAGGGYFHVSNTVQVNAVV